MTFILLKFLKGKQVIKSVKRIKIKKDIRTGPNSQIEKKKIYPMRKYTPNNWTQIVNTVFQNTHKSKQILQRHKSVSE